VGARRYLQKKVFHGYVRMYANQSGATAKITRIQESQIRLGDAVQPEFKETRT
jgi:hypothetical protein